MTWPQVQEKLQAGEGRGHGPEVAFAKKCKAKRLCRRFYFAARATQKSGGAAASEAPRLRGLRATSKEWCVAGEVLEPHLPGAWLR